MQAQRGMLSLLAAGNIMTLSNFSFPVDAALLKRFEELAGPDDGDGAALLRSFMSNFVETRDVDAGYESWFAAKVREGIESADAGRLTSNDKVEAEFEARRAVLRKILENQSR